MADLHNILDAMFMRLENTGSISNTNLMKVVTLSLINDYKDEMIACNESWRRILNDLENQLSNI